MAENTDSSLIPAPNREVTRQTVNLDEIRNCIAISGVHIPAGEGRQPISILPKPVFYRWEHGYNMIDVDPITLLHNSRKSDPVFFGLYLIGTGETFNEIRSIRLPVQTNGRLREIEEEIVRQMISDGLNQREIAQFTPEQRSQSIVGRAAGAAFRELFRALKYGHFETSGVDPQLRGPAFPNGMTLQSGWKEDDYWPLVIWSNWKAPVEVVFPKDNLIADSKEETIISPPFTQRAIDASDPYLIGVLNKAIQKNRK